MATFYDMTTLYFEASDDDDLRKCGFSKDGKHGNPQIFLGLLVAAGGNPIGYDIYEGNIFEGHTLMEFIGRVSAKFGADEAWDGIKGYVTNNSLSNEEVIARYSDLWRIEQAFRMNKIDLLV